MTASPRKRGTWLAVFNAIVVPAAVVAAIQPGVLSGAHIDQGLTSERASAMWALAFGCLILAWLLGNAVLLLRFGKRHAVTSRRLP